MAVNDPTEFFSWPLPDVGGDVGAWGGMLRAIFGEDGTGGPLGIDGVLKSVQDTADAALPATGGTMTGGLSIAPSGESLLTLNRGSETENADVAYDSLGNPRARAGITNNANADWRVRVFDDLGTGTNVLTINRATNEVSLSDDLTVGGALNVGSFSGDGSGLTNLNASELATGTVPQGRLSSVIGDGGQEFQAKSGSQSDPGYTFSGDTNTGMFRAAGNVQFGVNGIAQFQVGTNGVSLLNGDYDGDGGGLTNLTASALTGTAPLSVIPNLPASQTTSGTFADARIPNLNASKITSGEVAVARLPLIQAAVARSPLSLGGNATVAISVSVSGATSDSAAFVGIQEIGATESFSVTSNHCGTNTVTVVYQNQTGTTIEVPAHTLRIVVFRFQ